MSISTILVETRHRDRHSLREQRRHDEADARRGGRHDATLMRRNPNMEGGHYAMRRVPRSGLSPPPRVGR